jgi:hypothetical protein
LYLNYLSPSGGRDVNSGKRGNSAGTIWHSPTGIGEAIFSNVTATGGTGACCSCKGADPEEVFPDPEILLRMATPGLSPERIIDSSIVFFPYLPGVFSSPGSHLTIYMG